MKLRTRIMSALVACLMVVSLLPATAFAADSGYEYEPGTCPGHEYDLTQKPLSVLKPATCTATGIAKFPCLHCGTAAYQVTPAGHKAPEGDEQNETNYGYKAANCQEGGFEKYKCQNENCPEGDKWIEKTFDADPDAHVWGEEEDGRNATCTKGTVAGYLCEICGEVDTSREGYLKLDDAKGHSFELDPDAEGYIKATCQQPGVDVYVCQNEDCDEGIDEDGHGHSYTVDVAQKPHDFSDPNGERTEPVDPDCTHVVGYEIACAYDCGETQFFPLGDGEAPGHQWVDIPEEEWVAPDCETGEPGYTGGEWCSVCFEIGTGTGEGGNGGVAPTLVEAKHTPGEPEEAITKPATCLEDGTKTTTVRCTECKTVISTEEETISKTTVEHTPEKVSDLKPAGCTTEGIGKFKCSVCKLDLGYQVTPSGAHVQGSQVGQPVASTCLEKGYTEYKCQNCGENYKVYETELGAHNYGPFTYTATINNKEVTLTEAEAQKYVCVAVTKSKTCSVCEDVVSETTKDEEIQKHSPEDKTMWPDCTGPVTIDSVCGVCGQVLAAGEELPYNPQEDHTWIADESKKDQNQTATCTEAGWEWQKCSFHDDELGVSCEATRKNEIAAAGHSWSAAEEYPADCYHPYGALSVCEECGEEDFQDLSTLFPNDPQYKQKSHSFTFVDVELNGESCADGGTAAHYECANCDGLFVKDDAGDVTYNGEKYKKVEAKDLEIAAGGSHTSDGNAVRLTKDEEAKYSGKETVEPTCKEDGHYYTVEHCVNCGAVMEDTFEEVSIPHTAETHAWAHTGWLKYMNCKDDIDGIEKLTCSACNTTKYEVVEAAHKYEKTSEQAATCTADGSITYTCNNVINAEGDTCGDTYNDTIESEGHDFDSDKNPTNKDTFTCGEHTMTYHCQNTNDGQPCDATEDRKVAGDGKHAEYETTTTDPTCWKNSFSGTFCKACGEAKDGEELKENPNTSLGHDWVTDNSREGKKATCLEDGIEYQICSKGDKCDEYDKETGKAATQEKKLTATGHEWEDKEYYEADCGYNAGVLQECSVCHITQVKEFTEADGPLYEESATKGQHTWKNVEDKEGSCTEDGWKNKQVCEKCGKVNEDAPGYVETKATGHVKGEPTEEVVTAGNCVDKEIYDLRVYCKNCDYEYEDEAQENLEGETDPDNHKSLTISSMLKELTCEQDGIVKATCSSCGKLDDSSYKVVPHEGHLVPENPEDITIETPASCEAERTQKYTCQRDLPQEGGSSKKCGTEVTETIAASGHNWSTPEYDETWTCGERTTTVTCSNTWCTDNTKEVTDPGDGKHTEKVEKTEAECGVAGTITTVCEVCGETLVATKDDPDAPALEHDYTSKTLAENMPYKAPTCYEKGSAYYTCDLCGVPAEEPMDVDKIDHTLEEEWVDANCLGAGYVRIYCTVEECGYETTQSVPGSTGTGSHDLVKVEEKAATCAVAGNIEYYKCNVCEKFFSDAAGKTEITDKNSVVIGALGHRYSDSKDDATYVDPKCNADGYWSWTCLNENCDKLEGADGTDGTKTEKDTKTPRPGHVPNADAIESSESYKNANCGETVTLDEFTCTSCGNLIKPEDGEDKVTMTKPHNYGEEETTDATCYAPGSKTKTCPDCPEGTPGKTITTEVIPQLQHKYDNATPVYTYTVNGETKTIDSKDAFEAGYFCVEVTITKTCTTCPTDKADITPATDVTKRAADTTKHTIVESYEEANCEHGYMVVQTCSVCGYTNRQDIGGGASGTGHSWVIADDAEYPDCTETNAKIKMTCTKCNETEMRDYTTPGSHTFTGDNEVKEATCEEDGYVKNTCDVCHKEVTISSTPALKHDVKTYTVAANCGHGNVKYTYCARCNTLGADGIPVKGNGTYEVTSEDDGAIDSTAPHQMSFAYLYKDDEALLKEKSAYVLKVPTCTTDGIAKQMCEVCGTLSSWLVIPALQHKATEVGGGEEHYPCQDYTAYFVCSRCEEYWEETVKATEDHVFEEWSDAKNCYVCIYCGTPEPETEEAAASADEAVNEPEVIEEPEVAEVPEVIEEPEVAEEPEVIEEPEVAEEPEDEESEESEDEESEEPEAETEETEE